MDGQQQRHGNKSKIVKYCFVFVFFVIVLSAVSELSEPEDELRPSGEERAIAVYLGLRG